MTKTKTTRVSKKTTETLEHLHEKLGPDSIDEAIQSLIKKQRKAILEKTFSADSSRIKSFLETDRCEDHNLT